MGNWELYQQSISVLAAVPQVTQQVTPAHILDWVDSFFGLSPLLQILGPLTKVNSGT